MPKHFHLVCAVRMWSNSRCRDLCIFPFNVTRNAGRKPTIGLTQQTDQKASKAKGKNNLHKRRTFKFRTFSAEKSHRKKNRQELFRYADWSCQQSSVPNSVRHRIRIVTNRRICISKELIGSAIISAYAEVSYNSSYSDCYSLQSITL
jgi:hypothetical protein